MMAQVQDRPLLTCRECRRRKVKCDKIRPECSRCRDSRSQCVYESNRPPRTFSFIDETRRQAAPEPSNEEFSSSILTIPIEKLQSIEERVDRLAGLVQNLQHAAGERVSEDYTRGTPQRNTGVVKDESPVKSNDRVSHFAFQPGGRFRYVEHSFWISICKEVSELEQLLNSQNQYYRSSADSCPGHSVASSSPLDAGEASTTITPNPELEMTSGTSSNAQEHLTGDGLASASAWTEHQRRTNRFQYRQPSLISQLPPRQQCDLLVNSYIEGFHPLAPLVHLPTFKKSYENLWQTLAQPQSPASAGFVSLVLAIVFAGSVACPLKLIQASFPLKTHEETATALRERAIQAIRSSNFPSIPTLDSFAAYLICQGIWMREEEPLNCCAFIGLSFRVAQMLRLNEDPSHFKSLDPISAEVRRRIWWHVVHLDVSIAVASGLPPIIDLHCWNVQKPSELKDEYIGTAEGEQYDKSVAAGIHLPDRADDPDDVNGPSMVSTGGILAGGKLSSTYVMRKALSKLCGRTSPSNEDHSDMRVWFRNMTADLAARIDRIPRTPSSSQRGTVRQPEDVVEYRIRLNKWARLLLSGFIDRNWTVICHPILKLSVQQLWPNIYHQGLSHCIMLLKKAAHLACITDFRHFQWSWPGIHQPLHPLMIVLQDAIERPFSEIAEVARLSVDIAFALLGPSEGFVGSDEETSMRRPLTDGGAETWEYLGRLRSTAWLKAGRDPSIFWTRQQATAFCLSEPDVDESAAPIHTTTVYSESLVDPSLLPTDTMMTGQDFTNSTHELNFMGGCPGRWYDGLNDFNFDAVGFGVQ